MTYAWGDDYVTAFKRSYEGTVTKKNEEIEALKDKSIRVGNYQNEVIKKLPNYGSPLWSYADPPIRVLTSKRGGHGTFDIIDRTDIQLGVPSLEEQKGFLKKYNWPDWNKIKKVHTDNIDDLKTINLFDEIFSPHAVFHKNDDKLKVLFKHFQEIPYLGKQKMGELEEKCEDIKKQMTETRLRVLKDLEERLLKQERTFEEKILQVVKNRKKAVDGINESSFYEKIENDEVKLRETTPLSKLIMYCEDALRIVFSYLKSEDLILNFFPVSSYFIKFVKDKMNLSIRIPIKTMDLVPLEKILDGFRVDRFVLGKPWFEGQIQHVILNKDRFSLFLNQKKKHLREIKMYQLDITQIGKLRRPTKENIIEMRKEGIFNKTQEMNSLILNSWKIYEQIGKCELLESLLTPKLPDDCSNLKNLKKLVFPINYRNIKKRNVNYGGWGSEWDRPKFHGNYYEIGSQPEKTIQSLGNVFEKKCFPRLKELHLIDTVHFLHFLPSSEKDSLKPEGMKKDLTQQYIELLVKLHDFVMLGCSELEKFSSRVLFGFENFSDKFLEYLALKVKNVRLYYCGEGLDPAAARGNNRQGGFGMGRSSLESQEWEFDTVNEFVRSFITKEEKAEDLKKQRLKYKNNKHYGNWDGGSPQYDNTSPQYNLNTTPMEEEKKEEDLKTTTTTRGENGTVPSSPQYDPSSPQYDISSPQYSPTNPQYSPTRPMEEDLKTTTTDGKKKDNDDDPFMDNFKQKQDDDDTMDDDNMLDAAEAATTNFETMNTNIRRTDNNFAGVNNWDVNDWDDHGGWGPQGSVWGGGEHSHLFDDDDTEKEKEERRKSQQQNKHHQPQQQREMHDLGYSFCSFPKLLFEKMISEENIGIRNIGLKIYFKYWKLVQIKQLKRLLKETINFIKKFGCSSKSVEELNRVFKIKVIVEELFTDKVKKDFEEERLIPTKVPGDQVIKDIKDFVDQSNKQLKDLMMMMFNDDDGKKKTCFLKCYVEFIIHYRVDGSYEKEVICMKFERKP